MGEQRLRLKADAHVELREAAFRTAIAICDYCERYHAVVRVRGLTSGVTRVAAETCERVEGPPEPKLCLRDTASEDPMIHLG